MPTLLCSLQYLEVDLFEFVSPSRQLPIQRLRQTELNLDILGFQREHNSH